jgi:hypothetical protein
MKRRVLPFTALNIAATCEATDDATIIGFREGANYPLLARYEFPGETPDYEIHWLTKEGALMAGVPSVYDLRVVR